MGQDEFEARVAAIRTSLEVVQSNIARASHKTGRDPAEIKLVAVTKMMPLETIQAALAAGITCFGENYPEQAAEKICSLTDDSRPEWHMIGHIQSRKADTVCQYFNWVHSVDRLKIAHALDRNCAELGKVMPILIEVNLSGEESKYGFPAWEETRWGDLLAPFNEIVEASHLSVRGLMSMPPLFDDPEATRPLYKRLKRLQQFLRNTFPSTSWDELSIGTSFDYEVAVEEGATMVRIGTTLFGARPLT